MEIQSSIQECPFCNRVVHFSHDDITFLQHDCGVVLERKKGNPVQRAFQTIQQPVAIIQKGTEGKWEGRSFKVLGRFRAWLKESVYNYWTILFNDSTLGYLAEGYGLYAVHLKIPEDVAISSQYLQKLKIGDESREGILKSYQLVKKDRCHAWEMEGEISFKNVDYSFSIYEFSKGTEHIEIFLTGEQIQFFRIDYLSYSDLSLTNIREFKPDEKTIICRQCSKENTVKTYPYAQSFGCMHCRAWYALQENGEFRLAGSGHLKTEETNITLGSFAWIEQTKYEVLGYALKQETNAEKSQWKEYTLFNPQEGYAFLSEYDGNYIIAREKGNAPVLLNESITQIDFDKEPFLLFNRYGFKVISAVGEFPGNLFNDGNKAVREYISPPEVWIYERTNGEGINWFLGEHISQEDLKDTLGDQITLLYKGSVGAVEPTGFVSPSKIILVALIAVVSLFITHLATINTLESRVIVDGRYELDSSENKTFVTDKFKLDRRRSNLQFEIQAPVSNSWFELNVTLVNAATGAEYNIEKGIEYYHGYSEGEAWTEGSEYASEFLNEVPAGTYYLQISGTSEPGAPTYPDAEKAKFFSLSIVYDTANNRNLWYCFLGILVIPVCQFLWVRSKEASRWKNSPFSPNNQD